MKQIFDSQDQEPRVLVASQAGPFSVNTAYILVSLAVLLIGLLYVVRLVNIGVMSGV